MTSSVILEAEVVPYNETGREGARGPGIEEFWHLGAAGVTADDAEVSQWKSSDRHLCLVFFDILHLDGQSLLGTCYKERRRYLQDVVFEVPGFVSDIKANARTAADASQSQIVERTPIPLSRGSVGTREALQGAFDKSNAAREGKLNIVILQITANTL
jgi:DNA ligase-4